LGCAKYVGVQITRVNIYIYMNYTHLCTECPSYYGNSYKKFHYTGNNILQTSLTNSVSHIWAIMLGFLTWFFIISDRLWLNYYFCYFKARSVLPISTPSAVSNTTLISTTQKPVLLTAVLTNTTVTGKTLIR
jgi:hypothetical protein